MRTHPLRRPTRRAALALAALLPLCACTSSEDVLDGPPPTRPGAQTNNVLDRADALGLDVFAGLARTSSLRNLLENVAPLTVFAPTDAAFAVLPAGRLDELQDPADSAARDQLVGRLVVGGTFDAALLAQFSTLVGVSGEPLGIGLFGASTTVDAALITGEDDGADNGLVHVLDAVPDVRLTPIDSLERAGLSTMVQLLTAAGLDAAVDAGDVTVLAPTEAAFAALPPGELDDLLAPGALPELLARLRTHLIPGPARANALLGEVAVTTEDGSLVFFAPTADGATVNGAALGRVNRPTVGGGLIHELDAFLPTPPDLGDALQDPDLSVLDTLVFAASLGPALEQTEPLTLFAPTDAAFAALPPGTVDDLVMPANAATLLTLLQSHGVADARAAGSLADGDSLTTLSGSTIAVTDDGAPLLDGVARIQGADRYVRNGIVHVIDAVLAADGL